MKAVQQIEFSSVFFDTLFGLVLFFSMDSFMDIKDPAHFVFYLFSTIVLVHWWLIFKSCDDIYREEVTDSALDLVFGIVYVILIEYFILYSKDFNYMASTYYLLALFIVDIFWTLVWRFAGRWKTKSPARIKEMERELMTTMKINLVTAVLFIILLVVSQWLSPAAFVILFVSLYMIYIRNTFKYGILDVKIF